jgi:hypothetical protein
MTDETRHGDWFSRIEIVDPSVMVCSWLSAQLFMLCWYFDGGPYRGDHLSYFDQWYGFWVFWPTHLFNMRLCLSILLNQTTEVQRIKSVFGAVMPTRRSTNYEMLPVDAEPPDPLDLITPQQSTAAVSDWSEVPDPLNEGEFVDGFAMTTEDYAREAALDRSLLSKWLLTWPSVIFASVKISYDQAERYSWFVVFVPLYLYFAVLLSVAVQRGNWFMRKQREIDRADARERRRLQENRRLATAQIRSTTGAPAAHSPSVDV